MDSYQIIGGNRLFGKYRLSGAKNAVLPILAATLINGDKTVLRGCSRLSDVYAMLDILQALGCKTTFIDDTITVDSSTVNCFAIPEKLMREMRSSLFLMGPMLARFGQITLGYPGGCEIGNRPIDIHLKALRSLGAEIVEEKDCLICRAERLIGTDVHLDFPSVGATENVMIAALGAEGTTRIFNSAKEPEIYDLQEYLRCVGAEVSGAGTGIIEVKGTRAYKGTEFTVMPDRIEAGTYLVAAAITGGEITLENARPETMAETLSKLMEAGCKLRVEKNTIHLSADRPLKQISSISTLPYPGFPTDMQSQMLAFMTTLPGEGLVEENIFENRFKIVPELIKMGAQISVSDTTACVKGVPKLKSATVRATDLRGGVSLVLAALAAEGRTIVDDIYHIDRGYDGLENVLRQLGAEIERCR